MPIPFKPARLIAGLLALPCATTAVAATSLKNLMSSPAGLCQAALPNYEGSIRKRPLAVVNEGVSTAFVTCSFPVFQTEEIEQYQIRFRNRSASAATVNCTAVNGSEITATPAYFPKFVELMAGGTGTLLWRPSDGIIDSRPTSLSCALPPGVSIGELYSVQLIDIGA